MDEEKNNEYMYKVYKCAMMISFRRRMTNSLKMMMRRRMWMRMTIWRKDKDD